VSAWQPSDGIPASQSAAGMSPQRSLPLVEAGKKFKKCCLVAGHVIALEHDDLGLRIA